MMTRRSAGKVFPSPESRRMIEPPLPEAGPPPASPVRSVIAAFNRAVAAAPEPDAVVQAVEEKTKKLYVEGEKTLTNARTVRVTFPPLPLTPELKSRLQFLSNAKNISSLTIMAELLFIIYTFVPWAYYAVGHTYIIEWLRC